MTGLLFAAIAFSLAIIVLLWRGDPKRRRVAGLQGSGHGAIMRRLMSAAVLLPGLALAAAGDSPAFLVWFGSCAIGGWLVALRPSRSDSIDSGRKNMATGIMATVAIPPRMKTDRPSPVAASRPEAISPPRIAPVE
jgi:hypothetical protein